MYHKHLKNFIPLNHSSADILQKPMTEKTRVGWFLDFVVITFVITSASSLFENFQNQRTSGSGWFFEKIQKTGRICERTSNDPTIQGRFFDQFFGLWRNRGTMSKSVLWGYKNHWSRVYEWWLVLSKKKSAQHWKKPPCYLYTRGVPSPNYLMPITSNHGTSIGFLVIVVVW